MLPQLGLDNPFNITKATDFSNEEINDYWVDFFTKEGEDLFHYLNPKDLTPKYIIGGKGCGKTHLLRYYSFPLQKLRNSGKIETIIQEDKYIGLNIELGSMNSARMYGSGIKTEQWDAIFAYYLELFVCINLLDIIEEIFGYLKTDTSVENRIIERIKKQICAHSNLLFGNTIADFKAHLVELKKNLDYHINNAALKRSIDFKNLEIKFSPGDLFFEIPRILTSEVSQLKDIRFVFILDELEKLREYQKIHINTLVWDRRRPSTFWIGARTYGFTTRETKSGEVLRNGSEYQGVFLDEIMREDEERYQSFALSLCIRRLKNIVNFPQTEDREKLRQEIDKYFSAFDEESILKKITSTKKKELPHQRNFKNKVKEGIAKKILRGITDKEIDQFFEEYIKDDNLLYEKYKMLLFYKQWSKTNSISEIIQEVKKEVENLKKGEKSKIKSYEEKYKTDLLAQLLFENNLKIFPYSGINTFIKISSENPRAFFVILKEIFERSRLNQEYPFQAGKKISIESQSLGIYFASKWFYEDTEAYGDDGKKLYKCVYNLATLLQGIRFSDKPSETSPSSFSYKPDKASSEADKFIRLSDMHRILIQVGGRRDKNSERIEMSFQVNRMVSPYFNLPISRRGIVPLNESLIEAIFNPEKHSEFQSLFTDFVDKMNAPFGIETQSEMFTN